MSDEGQGTATDAHPLGEARELHRRLHAAPRTLTPAQVAERDALDTAAQLRALGIPAEDAPEAGRVWVVVGKMGSGKSTWAKAQVATWPESARVLCFDYCDEWSRYGRASKHVRLGPLRQRMTVDELLDNPGVLDAPNLSLAVVPQGTRAERCADFQQLIECLDVTEGQDRDLCFIVEEVWATASHCRDEYGTLATLGRHSGLSMTFIAQWASAIPHEVRRQASLVAAHRQDFEIDLAALVPPMPQEQAERVAHLSRGEVEIWREDAPKTPARTGGRTLQLVREREQSQPTADTPSAHAA